MNNNNENLDFFLAPHTHLIKCNKRLPRREFNALPKSLKNQHLFVGFTFLPKKDNFPQNLFSLPSQSRMEPFKDLRTYVSTLKS